MNVSHLLWMNIPGLVHPHYLLALPLTACSREKRNGTWILHEEGYCPLLSRLQGNLVSCWSNRPTAQRLADQLSNHNSHAPCQSRVLGWRELACRHLLLGFNFHALPIDREKLDPAKFSAIPYYYCLCCMPANVSVSWPTETDEASDLWTESSIEQN